MFNDVDATLICSHHDVILSSWRFLATLRHVCLRYLSDSISLPDSIVKDFYLFIFLIFREKMLKFVRTKNFKMPGNRQMLNIELNKDESGNWVQKERWEESLVISTAEDTEPKVVKVPFTKTYTTCTDEKTGKTTVLEQIDAQQFSRAEMRRMVEPEPEKLLTSPSVRSSGNLPGIIG